MCLVARSFMTGMYLAKNPYPTVEQLGSQLPSHRLNPLPIPKVIANRPPFSPIASFNNRMVLHRTIIYLHAKFHLSIRLRGPIPSRLG